MYIIIAAISTNNVIGKDNKLPWRLKNDLIHFKSKTENKTVLMGSNTFESLNCKALPNRKNIVLTRTPEKYKDNKDIVILSSFEEVENYKQENNENIYVIGGSYLYNHYIDMAEVLHITVVYANIDGDSFFPEINSEETYEIVSSEFYKKDSNNEFEHAIFKLIKRSDLNTKQGDY